MTEQEILRRLRVLVATPQKERPISLYFLAILAGLPPQHGIQELAQRKSMWERTRVRLERALTWVENDQVRIKKGQNVLADITIGAPRPPQVTQRIVQMTKEGPRVRSLATNPRAFPVNEHYAGGHHGQSAPQDSRIQGVEPGANRSDERNKAGGRRSRCAR